MKRSSSFRLENPLVPEIVNAASVAAALVYGKIFGIKPDKTDILRHSFNPYLH